MPSRHSEQNRTFILSEGHRASHETVQARNANERRGRLSHTHTKRYWEAAQRKTHHTTWDHIHTYTHTYTNTLLRGCRCRVGAVAGGELRGRPLSERDQHATEVLPLVVPAVPPRGGREHLVRRLCDPPARHHEQNKFRIQQSSKLRVSHVYTQQVREK